MYQVLMVDDEIITLEAMESGIHWQELGVSEIFKATNAAAAKQILNEQNISVMICDIEMSNGTGIDLLKWAIENQKECICIFLTCHSEFDYARDAVELGAMDYLLKPVEYSKMEQVLLRAIQKQKEREANQRAKVMLTGISRQAVSDLEEEPNRIVETVTSYIRENISKDICVKELANSVYLNPDYLSRVFKKETGYCLKDYIVKTRMSIAGELLVKTNLSVSKIAMSCGYTHMAHFSQMFKKETGRTPNEYRVWFRKNRE